MLLPFFHRISEKKIEKIVQLHLPHNNFELNKNLIRRDSLANVSLDPKSKFNRVRIYVRTLLCVYVYAVKVFQVKTKNTKPKHS